MIHLVFSLAILFQQFMVENLTTTDFPIVQDIFVDMLVAGKVEMADESFLEVGGVLMLENEISNTPEQRKQLLNALSSKVSTYSYDSHFNHSKDQVFQLGTYMGVAHQFTSCIAWKRENEVWKKEIEIIISKLDNPGIDLQEIEAAREKWVKLSNELDHKILVHELYGERGVYVNNGNVFNGELSISERYSYMSSPDWKISLHPIELIPIKTDKVLEIGTYISGGKGHYCILWHRQADGSWVVKLDFNY